MLTLLCIPPESRLVWEHSCWTFFPSTVMVMWPQLCETAGLNSIYIYYTSSLSFYECYFYHINWALSNLVYNTDSYFSYFGVEQRSLQWLKEKMKKCQHLSCLVEQEFITFSRAYLWRVWRCIIFISTWECQMIVFSSLENFFGRPDSTHWNDVNIICLMLYVCLLG